MVGIIGLLFCLIGLVFFFIKEDKVTGQVSVTVSGPGVVHSVRIQAISRPQVLEIKQRVDYATSLVHSARGRA